MLCPCGKEGPCDFVSVGSTIGKGGIRTKFRMDDIVLLVNIHSIVFGVLHNFVEIDALVWCILVYDREGIDIRPHVRYNGDIPATCGTHPQYLEAVNYNR